MALVARTRARGPAPPLITRAPPDCNPGADVIIPFMYTRKALYYREKASRMYSPHVYALVGGWTEIPFVFLEVAFFVNILCG